MLQNDDVIATYIQFKGVQQYKIVQEIIMLLIISNLFVQLLQGAQRHLIFAIKPNIYILSLKEEKNTFFSNCVVLETAAVC